MQRTPLDPTTLSAAVQRALGPGPGRAMASRGMLPLPPADQVAVLYQLSLDADATIAGTARATAANLPDKLLAGTLADASIDPRVLDLFAELAATKPGVFDAIALNGSAADATIARLATVAGVRETELIAQNEQRLLRHPDIIAALYMNRHARMSTIDRVVELAVRNNVKVNGIAAWDEVVRGRAGATGAPADDAVFSEAIVAASGNDEQLTAGDADEAPPEPEGEADADPKKVPIDKLSIPMKIRLATLGNAFARSTLVRDPIKLVAIAAIKSPGVSDMEAARYAGNQGLAEDVIRYIAQKREWTKLYGVKVSLCRNPKTPLSDATRFMSTLRDKDLVNLTRSKGVPSALVAQARRLMMQRRGGGK